VYDLEISYRWYGFGVRRSTVRVMVVKHISGSPGFTSATEWPA